MIRKLLFMLFVAAFISAVIGLVGLGERAYPYGKVEERKPEVKPFVDYGYNQKGWF